MSEALRLAGKLSKILHFDTVDAAKELRRLDAVEKECDALKVENEKLRHIAEQMFTIRESGEPGSILMDRWDDLFLELASILKGEPL